MLERGDDALTHDADAFGEVDKGRDAAAARPRQPPVERFGSVWACDGEDVAQALLEQVAAVEPGVGLGDPFELVALAVGEVFGVLPQRIAGVLERAGVTGASCRPRPLLRLGPWRRASFQACRRTSSRASVAHLTTWKGSAHCTACGQRSVTTSATQSAWSADTCVIRALRWGPSVSKNLHSVARSRPGAAHSSRPVSWSATIVR